MKKAIKQKIKELQEEMDKICPEGKSLYDLHNEPKATEYHKYQFAQTVLEELIEGK